MSYSRRKPGDSGTNGPVAVPAPEVKIINSQSCILCWRPHEKTVHPPLNGYYVEQMRLDSFGWARVNKIATQLPLYLVSDLVPGRRYKFQIVTEDNKGRTSLGKETDTIQPLGRPYPPSGLTVSCITHRSCFLEWKPPEWDGGTVVTQYLIEKQRSYCSAWEQCGVVDGTTYAKRIDGLEATPKCTFQIKAVNKMGTSAPSAVSQTIKAIGNDVTDHNYLVSLDDQALQTWGLACVSESFNRGVDKLTSIVELIQSQNDSITYWAEQKLSSEIQSLTATAFANMQNANLKIQCLINELNDRIEALAREQSQKESDLREKEAEIRKIQKEIKALENQLRDLRIEKLQAEADFFKAEDQLRQAEEELRRQKRKRKKAKGFGAVVGAVVGIVAGFAINPIAGVALGGLTFAACKNMDDVVNVARQIRDIAEQNRNRQRERVEEKKDEIAKTNDELSDRKSERDQINREIEQLKENIKGKRERMAVQTDISINMKQCSTFVTVTTGRTEILHDQTRFLYQPASLLGPLRELASHLSLSNANRLGSLLVGNKVESMIFKVRMISDADDSWRATDLLEHQKDLQLFMGSKSGKNAISALTATNMAADNISSYKDALDDAVLIMSHYAGWEQLLSPAPMTVAFLGQLLLLSLKKDFPLNSNRPVDGFKLLRQPDSFRVSILQIINDGWNTFNTTHGSMDQIRIYMQTVPEHLTAAFNILATGSDDEVRNFLHLPLAAIKLISDKCLLKARKTEGCYLTIVKLIAELQEACSMTKGVYERQRHKKRINQEVAREEIATVEEERRELERRRQKFQESINEAEKQFDDAASSLPGEWNMFGMGVVDGIASGFRAALDLFSKPVRKTKANPQSKAPDPSDGTKKDKLDKKIRQIHAQAVILQNIVNCLVSLFVEAGELKIENIQNSSKMIYCESQIQFIIQRVKKVDECPAKKQMQLLCERSITVCRRLEKERIAFSSQKIESGPVAREITLIQEDVNSLVGKLKVSVDSIEESKPPNRQFWHLEESANKGMVKYELAKVKARVEHTSLQLEYAQDRYDEVSKSINEASSRLGILIGVMARLDMELLSIDDIIDLLGRGMRELGYLRQSWGKIVTFLGSISNLIDCTLNVSLANFIDIAKPADPSKHAGYTISHLRRDMLYYQVVHAAELANFLSMLASSYTDVSRDYLLPNIESLLQLLKIDPETQKEKLREHSQLLKVKCEAAQQNICQRMKQKNNDFHHNVQARIVKLDNIKNQQLAKLEQSIQSSSDVANLNPDDFV